MEELKSQMRVDFEEEDNSIELYGIAAEDAVIGYTARTLENLRRIAYEEQTGIALSPEEELPAGNWFPARLKVLVLMIAAHNYRNREPVAAVAQNVVPYAFEFYGKPYRKLTDREE